MADFLTGLTTIPYFINLFLFVFVLIFMYAAMQYMQLFKASKGLHIALSFFIALFIAVTPIALQIIRKMIPPFIVFFIFVILVLVGFMLFGVSHDDISATIKGPTGGAIKWGIFIAGAIIVIGVIANVFGQAALERNNSDLTNSSDAGTITSIKTGETGGTSFSTNLTSTFYHPKILGFIALMLVAVAAVGLMATESKK